MGASDSALGRVYGASYRRLVGQLYGVCGDLAEAEDVVQQVPHEPATGVRLSAAR